MGVSGKDLNKAIADARLDVAASVMATTAGIALGASPVLATAVGASGPALKLAHRLSARALEQRQNRAARALEQAAQILDAGLDILEERTTSDDRRLELLARVLEAAARTPVEEKITALARVLAEGLRVGGSVEEALVLAAALADIEAAHVIVLHHVAATPLPPPEMWTSDMQPRGWDASQVARAKPEVAGVIDGLIAVLAGHGLIRTLGDGTWDGVMSSSMYAVTPLGRKCLFLLGQDVPPEP